MLSLRRLHRFLRPTRTEAREGQDRGSVAVFAAMWLVAAVLGCTALVGMTRVISERGRLQNAADVVALALVTGDESTARLLATQIGVGIRIVTRNGDEVTVTVTGSHGWATATASGR